MGLYAFLVRASWMRVRDSESVETKLRVCFLSFLVPPFPPRALRRRRGRGESRTMNDFDSFDTNRDGSLSFAVRPRPPTRARPRDPPIVRGRFTAS